MIMKIEWQDPLPMKRVRAMIYGVDLDQLPTEPGLYVFGRRWGDNFEALYVGKAMNVRSRIKAQLNSVKLMQHLRDATKGGRLVVPGILKNPGGKLVDKRLRLAERALIRYFLSEGHDLVNIHGTLLRRHEVESTSPPMSFVPKWIYLDSR
ncbi:MAG: GIY-YIG nuclease family protein [Actinomycetota bacterium]|nr:GIY-YIG nuclease family protein [Actinomycetota bacterium]